MIPGIKAFWNALVSGDETEVDSVIFAGVVALVALIACQIYVMIQSASGYNPMSFATGASTVIAAIGTSKGARHRLCGIGAAPDVPATDKP